MKRRGIFGSGVDPFSTRLNDEQEKAFQEWRSLLPSDLQNEHDYDLRGAFLADARAAANGHMPDTYKKPNHPTFSEESRYSTLGRLGGKWVSDGKGGWVFWASPTNSQNMTLNDLSNYFRRNEPGNTVVYSMKDALNLFLEKRR